VADAARNPLLSELYRNLAAPLRASMAAFWDSPGFAGAAPEGHEDLLAALRAHDPAEAARQAGANITETLAWHTNGPA
ncbi:FCD domain-containing protein, partial [Streptomyces sp. NPDC057654]|uniref:FCD domain-containing protein n=1 Tax=Streptomyces sp. NPDC057654 TaxID=3346196 RepID=UPI003681350C